MKFGQAILRRAKKKPKIVPSSWPSILENGGSRNRGTAQNHRFKNMDPKRAVKKKRVSLRNCTKWVEHSFSARLTARINKFKLSHCAHRQQLMLWVNPRPTRCAPSQCGSGHGSRKGCVDSGPDPSAGSLGHGNGNQREGVSHVFYGKLLTG